MTDTFHQLMEEGGQNRTCAQHPGIHSSLPLPYLSSSQQQTLTQLSNTADCSAAAHVCLGYVAPVCVFNLELNANASMLTWYCLPWNIYHGHMIPNIYLEVLNTSILCDAMCWVMRNDEFCKAMEGRGLCKELSSPCLCSRGLRW